jgi:hypothetical protein
MEFVELPTFTRSAAGYLSDIDLRDIQNRLMDNPEAGRMMRGTGGLRKLRVGLQDRGRSDGGRVIYYLARADRILLVLFYPKNMQANPTQEQLRTIRKLLEA